MRVVRQVVMINVDSLHASSKFQNISPLLKHTMLIPHFMFSPLLVLPYLHQLVCLLLTSDILICQTSLGKNNSLHPHIPATSTTQSFGSIGFRFVQQTHPDCMSLYVVRVPQARALLSAPFQISPHDGRPLMLVIKQAYFLANSYYCQAIIHASALHSSTDIPVVFCPSG